MPGKARDSRETMALSVTSSGVTLEAVRFEQFLLEDLGKCPLIHINSLRRITNTALYHKHLSLKRGLHSEFVH